MATAFLESISIPRIRSNAASSPRTATSTIAASIGVRKLGFAMGANGLTIARRRPRVTSSVVSGRGGVVRRASVVCEAQDTAVDVRDVTKDTWQSLVMECDKPVLVEFWAPWCGPCRMILPVIAKLSKTYEGKLECYKINTDECPEVASQYGIRSIPTIIIFKNGEKKDAVIGAVPESTLVSSIDKFV